jgi:hypothetical protein
MSTAEAPVKAVAALQATAFTGVADFSQRLAERLLMARNS